MELSEKIYQRMSKTPSTELPTLFYDLIQIFPSYFMLLIKYAIKAEQKHKLTTSEMRIISKEITKVEYH